MFRVTMFSDIAEAHVKSYTVESLFGAAEMSVVYGLPGAAKSAWVGDGAAHVAAGMTWQGRTVRRGVVMYLAAERHGLVKRRLTAFRIHHGVKGDIPLAVLDGMFDFCGSEEHAGEIVTIGQELAELYGLPVVWVIIDTKAQVLAGGDPNSDKDVQSLVRNGRRIMEGLPDAHLTFVDHVPHGSPDRMKGSGALAGAVDASYLVKKEGALRTVTIGSKAPNDGPDELEIAFTLRGVVVGRTLSGEPLEAPVVIETAPAANDGPPSKRPALKMAAQKILTAFNRARDDGPTIPIPISLPGVDPGIRGIMLADLKAASISLGIVADPEPNEDDKDEHRKWREANRKAFNRGIEDLVKIHMLRIELQHVWNPYERQAA